MIIDHVGVVFFPDFLGLRIIGRIAFILYAFLLTEGFFYTSNLKNYKYKLLYWAVVSEVPFDLAFNNSYLEFSSQNIFWTLFVAMLGLEFFQKNSKKYILIILVGMACVFIAHYLNFDFSWYGVLVIFIFYWMKKYKFISIFKYTLIQSISFFFSTLQIFTFVSFLPIIMYNGKLGKKIGNIYYSFYAIHIYLLFFIRDFIIPYL